MIKKLYFFLYAAGFVQLACPVYADIEASRATFAQMVAGVKYHRLSNGLRVMLYRRGTAPVFSAVIGARVGGSDEPSGQTGISHLLEHMAFKGTQEIGTRNFEKEKKLLDELERLQPGFETRSLPPLEEQRWHQVNAELRELWDVGRFTREYEKRGAAGLNASTDVELTRYYVSLPRPALEFWCYMESERILRPVMRQFYEERDVVLEERRTRYEDNPRGRLYELLIATAYRVHPYRNPVIGYAFDISRLTAAQMLEFQRQYYVPGNIALALVGDVDEERDMELIERYFGRLSAGPNPPRPFAVEPPQEGQRHAMLEAKAAPRLKLAYRKPQYPHTDDAPISVMAEILSGGRLSPLYSELVKQKHLATSVSHYEGPGFAYPNLLIFQVMPKTPHSNEKVLRGFDRVLEEFKRRAPQDEALMIAKRAIAMEYLSQLDSNTSLASQLVSSELIYGDWRIPLEWFDKVMMVSGADVMRVARQYLMPSQRTVVELRRSGN